MNIWHTLLYQPLINLLILFYQILFQNLGLAIIALTVAVRGALLPLTAPAMKSAQKMKDLAPELAKLKQQHKNDKQSLAQAQLKLYQKHGLNPAAGCLPQIIQIIILIALFQAFNQVLKADGDIVIKLNEVLYPALQFQPEAGQLLAEIKDQAINTKFLYLDLTQPDTIQLPFKILFIDKLPGLFLIAAALSQFLSSKMMMPMAKGAKIKAQKTPQQEDDLAAALQMQMLYLMPVMTLLIGFKFPSGLVLYWVTFSLFMLVQQLKMQKSNIKNQK